VRLAQISCQPLEDGVLEERVLLTSEQLGFRSFMFCGQFRGRAALPHEIRFDNFPVQLAPILRRSWPGFLPGPLRRLPACRRSPLCPGEKSPLGMAAPSPRRANSVWVTGFPAPSTDSGINGASRASRSLAAARSGTPYPRDAPGLPTRRVRHSLRGRARRTAGVDGLGARELDGARKPASQTVFIFCPSATARANV